MMMLCQCEHLTGSNIEGAWCKECIKQLLNENALLKKRVAALEELQSRQSRNHRLDFEDGLPWQEDDR